MESLLMNEAILGRQFYCCRSRLNEAFGLQNLAVACEVIVRHERVDDRCRKGQLPLLLNRHVDRQRKLPCGIFVTRESPGEDVAREAPYLSLAIRPPEHGGDPAGGELFRAEGVDSLHREEWEFLQEHVARALALAGVRDEASETDKARALADYAAQSEGALVYPSFHPVDVLLHSSYCSGLANLFFALANVSGLVCRSIHIANHSVVEVLIKGKWHFVDNHRAGGPLGRFVEGRDYVDVTLRVDECPFSFDTQIGYLKSPLAWRRSPYHYSSMLQWHWAWGEGFGNRGGRSDVNDGYGVSVPCDPCHASALYPGREIFPFPLWAGVPELTLTEKASWIRVDLPLPPSAALLKNVYFSASEDNPIISGRLEWWFSGEVTKNEVVMQWDGSEKTESPDRIEYGSDGVAKAVFVLPPEAAIPGRRNFVLQNISSRILRAVAYPTPLLEPDPVATSIANMDLWTLRKEPM